MIVMIDINDSEFLSRIEPKELLDKVCDGKTAAAMIQPGGYPGDQRIYTVRLSENHDA